MHHYEGSKYELGEVEATAVSIKTKWYLVVVVIDSERNLKKNYYVTFYNQLGETFYAKNTCWGSRITTTKGENFSVQ